MSNLPRANIGKRFITKPNQYSPGVLVEVKAETDKRFYVDIVAKDEEAGWSALTTVSRNYGGKGLYYIDKTKVFPGEFTEETYRKYLEATRNYEETLYAAQRAIREKYKADLTALGFEVPA